MSIVNGVHILIYTSDPAADRAFLRDVLGFKSVDAGHGWLIFALPPAEAALHPVDKTDEARAREHGGHQMLGSVVYLMCDDVRETVKTLAMKQVVCGEIDEAPWGLRTTVRLPSGGELGLYQPTHPTALNL